jgi:pyruvate/2-oxoglutarate dehydrogenase complex dihydrolipoamide acyltransferase (E2) component
MLVRAGARRIHGATPELNSAITPKDESMTTEIRVPIIANAGPKLSIGRWFKSAGDAVTIDEPLVEIDTDNVTLEIRAPVTGVLSKILVKDGGSVEAGLAVGTISQF